MNWNPDRAENYDNLQWVNDSNQINTIISIINSHNNTRILEVGCGTGQLTKNIASSCLYSVFDAIDQSTEMLVLAKNKPLSSVNLHHCRIEDFEPGYKYDTIVTRNVLHHVDNISVALRQCSSLLNDSGKLIVVEGIPAADGLDIFKNALLIKESRHILTIGDWIDELERVDFRWQHIYRGIFEKLSLNNILDNDGTLNEEKKHQIIKLYTDASDEVRQAYRVQEIANDIICDFAYVIIQGIKK